MEKLAISIDPEQWGNLVTKYKSHSPRLKETDFSDGTINLATDINGSLMKHPGSVNYNPTLLAAAPKDQYAIFVNVTLYQKYGDLLTAMRRSVNTAELLGGWTGLEFAAGAGRVGVFLDYDVPDGEVIILDMDTWTMCQVSDLDWLEEPNAGALIRLNNTIKYQATIAWFANVMCLAPAANAKETRKTD